MAMPAQPYPDPTTGEWVGEYETTSPDGEVTRQTEWFTTKTEARNYQKNGAPVMTFVAVVNTPGYLPEAEPAEFGTAEEAWDYLATERRAAEDSAETVAQGYSGTVNTLDTLATSVDWSTCENAGIDPLTGTGTVYGPTPGYEGDHDLGVAYSVTEQD